MAAVSLKEPIGADSPAGQDLSYDPAFEKVAKEVGKAETVDGGRPKWSDVERDADALLRERTKDLRLVVWSAVAKCTLRGFEGLADGLSQYLDVLGFWDVVYPPVKRLRARANLHEWLIQQSLPALEEREVTRADEVALLTAQATLQEIEGILDDKLGELHPGSTRLRTLLQRKLESMPAEEEPVPSIAEIPVSEAAPAAEDEILIEEDPHADADADVAVEDEGASEDSAVRAAPGRLPPMRMPARHHEPAETVRPVLVYEPEGLGDASSTIEASLEALLAAAKLIADDNPADGRVFRIRRAVQAMRFDPSELLEPPDDRERLADLFERGDLSSVIEEGEAALLARPAWLDAHRWVAVALARSGGMWAAAREVALEETMAMIARTPSLPSRRFTDDTPVATAETLAWIEEEKKRGADVVPTAHTEAQEIERQFAQVKELAAQDRVMDAITLATTLANRSMDMRGRFQGYLLAGTTALASGKPAIARPLLEGLLTLVERHQLESWEPAQCATLYASLLRCLRALAAPGAEDSSREKDLFDRLCRLDPAAAMRLGANTP